MHKISNDKMGAVTFSEYMKYRYFLSRRFNKARESKVISFIGLNPSTADENTNDNTIRKCMHFAKKFNFDEMYMLNIFAYRSTDPVGLRACLKPIGSLNDSFIGKCTNISYMTVICWGNNGSYLDRGSDVLKLLNKPKCFGINNDGSPKHPLYLKNNSRLYDYYNLVKLKGANID